jgi:Ca2+-binding RTX toxin-like protein
MGRTRLSVALAVLAAGGIVPFTPDGTESRFHDGDTSCTDHPHTAAGEFASCVRIAGTFDGALTVGGSARLVVAVTAIEARAATIEIGLPAELQLRSGPPGLRDEGVRPDLGSRRYRLDAALAEGESRSFELDVTAVAPGTTSIELAAHTDEHDRNSTVVVVEVAGDTAGRLVAAAPAVHVIDPDVSAAAAAASDAPRVGLGRVELRNDDRAPTAASQAIGGTPQIAGQTCATAVWGFSDWNGQYRTAGNTLVELWDDDVETGDDLLAVGLTDPTTGFVRLCTTTTDIDGTPLAHELYLRFKTDNGLWRVRNSPAGNATYAAATAAVSVQHLSEHTFGTIAPTGALNRAFHISEAINRFYLWGAGSNGCFDWSDTTCRPIVVNWSNTSTDGNYYSPSTNQVFLTADGADYDHLIVHESAHSVMDDVYNDNSFALPNCDPHAVREASSPQCAWAEGFAEWVPAAVFDSSQYSSPSGLYDLEGRGWYDGTDTGDSVEGRVAGAMLDISDISVVSTDHWDTRSEGDPGFQWRTFQDYELAGNGVRPTTYAEFWQDRGQLGYDVSDAGANAANFQNTIDYGTFSDPLTPYVTKVRPKPMQAHRYSVANSAAQVGTNWAVVAMKPTSGSDYDLSYRELEVGGPTLALSSNTANRVELVAVDFNHRAAGPDWVMAYATPNGGEGTYGVQYAAGAQNATSGQHVLNLSSTFVAVRDLSIGLSPTYVRAVPAAGQDIELLLMDSLPSNSASFAQHRGQAVRQADTAGTGGAEAFSYTGTVDQAGLVVVSKGTTGGSVTLFVDASAPTGWVNIDGNAYLTPDTSVVLSLGATDTHTGIVDMRVAVDGALDTEPWEPYTASKAVTLPAGQGTKTVRVQFRNGALMPSPVYSDSIELYAGPLCENQIPTHVGTEGNDTIVGTAGNDVVLALGGNDTIDAGGGNDTICAGNGDDTILPGPGADLVFGDAGRDTLSYASAAGSVTVDLGTMLANDGSSDALHTVEVVVGSGNADTLLGGAANDDISGGGGNDAIDGRGGDDVLRGGAGNDTLTGGAGTADQCNGGADTDTNGGGCEQVTGIP